MGLEPPSGAPYRTSARGPERGGVAPRRVRTGASVGRLLGVPRFVGVVLVGILAWTFGDLDRMIVRLDGVPTPEVVRAGNLAALVMLASIPTVSLLVWCAWRRLPAPRAVKRRSLRRSAALFACEAPRASMASVTKAAALTRRAAVSPTTIGFSHALRGRASHSPTIDSMRCAAFCCP